MNELFCKLLGHSWSEAKYIKQDSCQQTRTCNRCGQESLSQEHDWNIWQHFNPNESKVRLCKRCGEREERKIYKLKQLDLSFELSNAWTVSEQKQENWIKNLVNPSFVTSFISDIEKIEIVFDQSWEARSPSLRDSPLYNRATMRQIFFRSLLKKLGFKKIRFFTKAKAMPEYQKVRLKRGPMKVCKPDEYIPLYISYIGEDITYGNILAIYMTENKKTEWMLLCTVKDKNVYFRYFGDIGDQINDDLKTLLQSLTCNHLRIPFHDLWEC